MVVDYTDIVKNVVLCGIVDEEIKSFATGQFTNTNSVEESLRSLLTALRVGEKCMQLPPTYSGTEKMGAIFDTNSSICNPPSQRKRTSKIIFVEHHILDGKYGWMEKNQKQPTVILKLSTNLTIMKSPQKRHQKSSHLNCPSLTDGQFDTGAQSSLMDSFQ